jgi:hypothetical protein
MSKLITDAQGRKYDAAGKRVYDKAGPNTRVEAVFAGTYPAGHLRKPGAQFRLAEGDSIVDWMRPLDEEAPVSRPKASRPKIVAPDPAGPLTEHVEPQADPDLA